MSAERLSTDSRPDACKTRSDADPATRRTDIAVADLVSAIARRSPAARRAAVGQLVALGLVDEEIERLDAAAETLLQATRSITEAV